jgi:hypothetical protein
MKTIILVLISLCFTTMLQAQVSKTVVVSAGNLKTILTADELNSVTNLTLTGTIDARDFKMMRDDMPLLSVLDLNGVSIFPYYGNEGTLAAFDANYPANAIPEFAFCDPSAEPKQGKTSLSIVILPSSVTSIGSHAFSFCNKLVSVFIPSSVSSIGVAAFVGCTGLITVDTNNPNYLSRDGVLYNKDQTTLIQCSSSKNGSFIIPASISTIGLGAFYNSQLYFIFIPSSVSLISTDAFNNCSALASLYVNSNDPIDLSSAENVFSGVNKTTCTLNVPYGLKALYEVASQWKDFNTIVESPEGFHLSSTAVRVSAAAESTATVDVKANITWSAISDQTWLTLYPASGTGSQTLTFVAEVNPSTSIRKATVTVSATGVGSQTITVAQEASALKVTTGGLKTRYTLDEFSSMTKLKLSGTIDARDFKTMRDDMPLLSELDLSEVSIAAYSGSEGTASYVTEYPANEISELAFYSLIGSQGKTSLSSVILPNTITSIGNYAFQGCTGIKSITIPPSVTSIEVGAFFRFNGEFIVYPANQSFSCSEGVLFNQSQTALIQCPTTKTGNYNIPSSVKSIGEGAFLFCTGLTSVNIPASVNTIGNWAFQHCIGLISITANSGNPIDLTTSLDAFYGVNPATCLLYVPFRAKEHYLAASQWKDFQNIVEMPGLELSSTEVNLKANQYSTAKVFLSSNVNWKISSDQPWLSINPTYGTGSQTIYFSVAGNTSINSRTAKVKIEALGVPSQTITVMQKEGLAKSDNITAGNLKTQFTSDELGSIFKLTLTGTIDARDFRIMRDEMPMLAEIDLSGATIVEYTGFSGTGRPEWKRINYPANTIPDDAFLNAAFSGKHNLTSFILPLNTTSIGNNAFASAINLTSVTIPSSVTSIGIDAFNGCNGLNSLFIPKLVTNIYGSFGGFDGIFIVDADNINYSSLDGVLFNKTKTKLLHCPNSKTGDYTIPSSVTSIGDQAFRGCYSLTSINIPSNVNFIGIWAFMDCISLTAITIPPSVTILGNGTFLSCRGLTSITIPSTIQKIEESAFEYCMNLKSIYSNSSFPIDLSSSQRVFGYVDKTICTLYVPYVSKVLYAAADQWKDFKNIVEIPGLKISAEDVKFQPIPVTQKGALLEVNDQPESSTPFKCYPNPTTNKIWIETNSNLQGETAICIFSINGALLKQEIFQNQNLIEMDVSAFVKGIYVLKIQTEREIVSQKLVVQ